MLNMSSETAAHATDGPSSDDRDLTTRARIRDAAVRRFAVDGVRATRVRTIAADAGVSPPLVLHHFGSKDGLRVACDQHVATLVRKQKTATTADGPDLDPLAALRRYGDGPPLLRYLARTLVDGSPHVAELLGRGVITEAVFEPALRALEAAEEEQR